jgi:hypothetical protein
MQYGYGVPDDLLAPARRAGVLMIILGALTIVIGLCMGFFSAMLPTMLDQMQPEQREMFDQMQQQLPPPFTLSRVFMIMAVTMLVVGLLYIILGLLVRRGGLGMVITSIVLTSLVSLFLLATSAQSLFHPNGAMGGCMTIVALGLFILLLVWLIQAARTSSRIPQMQSNYQAQYQQYLQTQQMYGQAGYGYGTPQPTAPPQPPPTNQSPPPPEEGR